MNEHDIERHDGDEVVCTCGQRFPTAEKHEIHYQLAKVRAALKGAK